jgi:hypothetical protein
MRQRTRQQKRQRKQRKHRKSRRKNCRSNKLSNKLRGGDLGIPTILTLEGTPLSSNAVVAHPTYTESLQSYLANQRRRGSTGYDDGD